MKSFFRDFKAFVTKGSVLDMAVGVIIAGAFGKIVSSMVGDILMPLVGVLLGGVDFRGLSVTVGAAEILYGAFLQSVIDFLVIAFCVFLLVRTFKKITAVRKKEEKEPAPPPVSREAELLAEIRDLLKKDS